MAKQPSSADKTPDFEPMLTRLNRRAAELEAEVEARRQQQPANDPHDATDQQEEATSKVRAEIVSAEIERDLTELRGIALARERIEAGSYGECADCGKAIDPQRLDAQPTALRCIACQEKAEAAQRRMQ